MFDIGQQVMIVEESRWHAGALVEISEILVADTANGVERSYSTMPPVYVGGIRVIFRENQLAFLEEEVTQPGGLMDLEL